MNFFIYWGILMVANIGTIIWFYGQTLKPKLAPIWIFFIYYACNMLNTLVCAEMFGKYKYKTVIYLLYNAAVLIFLFSGEIARKLVSGFWIFIAQMLTEVGGFCLLMVLGMNISAIENYTAMKNVLVAIDTPLQWILCIGFLKVQKGFGFHLNRSKMWLVFKCYFCEMIIIFTVIILHWYFDAVVCVVLLISKFAFFAIMMYLMVLLKNMETKQITERKTCYLQQQSEMILKYSYDIGEKTKNLEELRKIYDNKLKEVYEAVKYKEVDQIENNKKEKKYHFENVIATQVSNCILAQLTGDKELAALEEKGNLKVELDFFRIPARIAIESLDLSALLYNLLENAYEAVERQITEDGNRTSSLYINAVATSENDRLFIRVKNSKSPNQPVVVSKDQWSTSKKNKKIHGYGMGVIKGIVEKYEGEMLVDYGEDWFETRLELCLVK